MLNIYIARHGQDEDNAHGILNGRRDTPLTQLGETQAQALAEKIKELGLTFDTIFASPLKRALQTAKIIAQSTNLADPVILPELIERDFGVMTGQPVASIKDKCAPDIIQGKKITYFIKPEGAETFPDLLQRATKLLAHIKNLHPEGSVLLVTHGDFGKMVYASFYGLAWEDVLVKFHFGNSELLVLSESSLASQAHLFRQQQYNH